MTLRLLGALALAFVIGGEREVNAQPAGLRTHMTVALGACLFGIISTLGFQEFYQRRDLTNVQVDVTRVASQVVVGIGFLGAGLIFRERGHVKNLTTAASLWATAAVGLAAGVGHVLMAAIATVALVLTLAALRPLGHVVRRRIVRVHVRVQVLMVPGAEPDAIAAAFETDPSITVVHRVVLKRGGAPLVELLLRLPSDADLAGRLSTVAMRPDVVDVDREAED